MTWTQPHKPYEIKLKKKKLFAIIKKVKYSES